MRPSFGECIPKFSTNDHGNACKSWGAASLGSDPTKVPPLHYLFTCLQKVNRNHKDGSTIYRLHNGSLHGEKLEFFDTSGLSGHHGSLPTSIQIWVLLMSPRLRTRPGLTSSKLELLLYLAKLPRRYPLTRQQPRRSLTSLTPLKPIQASQFFPRDFCTALTEFSPFRKRKDPPQVASV